MTVLDGVVNKVEDGLFYQSGIHPRLNIIGAYPPCRQADANTVVLSSVEGTLLAVPEVNNQIAHNLWDINNKLHLRVESVIVSLYNTAQTDKERNGWVKMLGKFINLLLYRSAAELRSEGTRTYAGYLWWILEPLMSLGVYYFAFKYILRHGLI